MSLSHIPLFCDTSVKRCVLPRSMSLSLHWPIKGLTQESTRAIEIFISSIALVLFLSITIRQTKVCPKKVFILARLCYSIQETMENLYSQISSAMSFWPYRYKISCNNGFQIRWWCSFKEIESAHMDGNREVCFICMLSLLFSNDYVRGNHFRKVIHNQMCIDFLMDAHHLFWMKIKHP